ncbi:MAG: hypothetical protein LBU88_02290 [Treponema sp.]|jgi:hypothetical protein|nr:hypothetical protein [Treponema sp.]
MINKILKYFINPLFSFFLCALIFLFIILLKNNDSFFILLVWGICIVISIISLIVSIIKSDFFSFYPSVISIFLIIFFSFLSLIFSIGNLIVFFLVFCIWIFCFIFCIITIILSIKNKINHILNYLLLFSLLFSFIGIIYTNINRNIIEKDLYIIVNKIESMYEISGNNIDINNISILMKENKNMKIYLVEVSEEYFIIRISIFKKFSGTNSIIYDSREKIIRRIGNR